ARQYFFWFQIQLADPANVPPVPNWFQVYDKSKALPKESPRFDEVSTMATPREQVGGEFRTPGPTPRKDFKAPGLDEAALWPARREGEMHYEGTYLGTMKPAPQQVAGKRHGIGTYTNAKGFTRRGTWQLDRPIKWEEPTEQSSVNPAAKLLAQSPSQQPEPLTQHGKNLPSLICFEVKAQTRTRLAWDSGIVAGRVMVFEKSLTAMVKGIRAHRGKESDMLACLISHCNLQWLHLGLRVVLQEYINTCITEIKNEVTSKNMATKSMAVLKAVELDLSILDSCAVLPFVSLPT
ncbi:AP3D1, partial [Symbiodinium microadriaticum]